MKDHASSEAIAMYLLEVANVEPLSKEAEKELLLQLKHSGAWNEQQENAARRLIESQLSFVVRIADKYSSSGTPMIDLIQEGNVGLMNAIKTFAQTPVGAFGAYAAQRIEESILDFTASRKDTQL